MLFALSTTNKIVLGLAGGCFIAFALVSALVIPRYRPQFPGRGGLPAYIALTAAFFVAMLFAVEFFGRESEKAAGKEAPPAATPSPAAEIAKGKALYVARGCQACHSLNGTKGVGPTWKGLAGSQVKLANGQTVAANDAYLLESIEDPDKQIDAGYQRGVMSAVIKPGSVSEADAKALIAFIKSVK